MIASLVFVIGGHWAVLQSLAWVGMAVNFAQRDTVSVALAKTFDGKHPCPLCKIVKAGQAKEKKQTLQKIGAKLECPAQEIVSDLFPPAVPPVLARLELPLQPSSFAPPVPPPRFA